MKMSVLVGLLVLGFAAGLRAQDAPAAAPDQAALEAMMMELAKVGPHHQRFQAMVGQWTTKSTYTPTGTDKPVTSDGTAAFELLMGGRFLQQTFRGEFHGMPFEGLGLSGYDNAQKKYVGIWIDNFGTGMMRVEGTVDENTGVLTEIGEFPTPGGSMKMKMVTDQKGADAMTFTAYMLGADGSETKHLIIEYTRQ
jgi:hypothetical protein